MTSINIIFILGVCFVLVRNIIFCADLENTINIKVAEIVQSLIYFFRLKTVILNLFLLAEGDRVFVKRTHVIILSDT